MSQILGLLVFGVIVIGFVLLFFYLNRRQRVEINAEFARARGWQFQDLLPQFGRAQRQHVLRGTSPEGIEWEMTMYLQQSTTTSIPTASTVWATEQIGSDKGLVVIGPQLEKSFDTLDLSHPLFNVMLKTMLGDAAAHVSDLQRVPIAHQNALTVLATDSEYAQSLVTAKILDYYQEWMKSCPEEKRFPICLLKAHSLQIKVREALTKAADVDTFVHFCLNIATFLNS